MRTQLLAALLAMGGWCGAQNSPAPKPPTAAPARAAAPIPSYKDLKYPKLRPIEIPNVATYTLPNGMKLYLLEDHELPVINGTARIRTGNLFDPADKVGLATMTGMVIRTGGTKSKTGDELDQELENMAASVESSIDETVGSVSFSALKNNGDDVMGIFKDVLTSPEFRPEKIELARSQLRSAISRRNDEPQEILRREFADILYGKNNPYGWDMEYATVDRITRGDLQNFYNRYFFPKNVMLAVWGDFDTATMKAKIEKLFSGWTAEQPAVPPFPPVSAKPAPGTYLAVKKDVGQTFFAIGQMGGEFKDKDYPALEILSDILGGGFQSRLMQRIRTKMGDAYDISANWGANYDHPGLFEIGGSTKSLSTVEVIKAVDEEVARIRAQEVSEQELKTAKDTALNSLVFAFDTKTKTLGRMLTYEYYGYPMDFIQQYQKALEAVTRADVLRVAKEHLNPPEFTTVAVGNPEDFGTPLNTLGKPVTTIDLTIPQAKESESKEDAGSLARGKQLLDRAQKAAGGADKIAGVKDSTRTAVLQIDPSAGGFQAKQTDQWIAPGIIRQESELPMGKTAVYFDGKSGWIATPQGSGALASLPLKQVEGSVFRGYFRMMLSDRIPGRKVNAIDDHTIEISDSEGQKERVSFDPGTGLPHEVSYESVAFSGPPKTVVETWSDFRDVDGVKLPFKATITQGGQKFGELTVSDYKLNTGLKPEDLGKKP